MNKAKEPACVCVPLTVLQIHVEWKLEV
jgi:hypothetical protein